MMKIIPIIVSALVLSSCASETPIENPPVTINDTLATVYEQVITPDLNPLPSPLQISFLFKQAGLEFQEGVGNDLANKSLYSSSVQKQLNLGIYSADFAYCALNSQRQQGTNYLRVVEEMAEELGLAGAYNTADNRDRFEANADNIDSVAQIISELQIQADQYFVDNNEQDKAFVIFTGAWIESMYLGAKTRDLSDNPNIAQTLLEQADILGDLLMALNTVENKDELGDMIGSLEEIQSMFDEMIAGQDEAATEVEVSAEKLFELINVIFTARKAIVTG
jgi:hypothetical protein